MRQKVLVENFSTTKRDPITNEVVECTQSKRITALKNETEPFFMVYSKQIMALYSSSILSVETKVLYKFMEFAEYNTGIVYMTPVRIDEIKQTCNISKASYYRAIKQLTELGIISGERNTYTIAENMYWKGDRESRQKLINARFSMTINPVFEIEDTIQQNNL